MTNLQVSPPEVDCECVKDLKPAMERGEDIDKCEVCGHYYWIAGKEMHDMFHDVEDSLDLYEEAGIQDAAWCCGGKLPQCEKECQG